MTVGTGVGQNCWMDNGYIFIEIDGVNDEHCATYRLEKADNDFEEGTKLNCSAEM